MLLIFPLVGMKGHAQNLNTYLKITAENNPKLLSAYAEFEAAMQRAPQLASMPDPSLTMSAFGRMVETRLGAQEARFSLMQMFPWFGTLQAKEDAALLMAEASFQKYLNLRNEVFFDMKSVYAEMYALDKTIQLKEENLKILDSYRELALSGFRSGNSPMVNVVKVDIQRDAALTEIELLREQSKPLQIQLNLMMRREPLAPITVQDTLIFGNTQVQADTAGLFQTHPTVTGLEKQRLAYGIQEKVAQKEGLPMVGLGVDYSIISKRTDANPEMNGQDAIMPMVSVTLPIFRKKIKAARREAELMRESIVQQQTAQENELRNSYELAVYELNRASKLLNLYERQLESSRQASKLLISAFGNSTGNFEEVLQMNQDIIMYQSQKIDAIKAAIIAEAKLEYLFSKNE